VHGARHQPVGFEGAQCAGEHALADALDGAVQFVVAVGAAAEQDDHEHAPAVAKTAEERADRAGVEFGLRDRSRQFGGEHTGVRCGHGTAFFRWRGLAPTMVP
jgi:hypothetical protein